MPFRQEGQKHVTVRKEFAARSATSPPEVEMFYRVAGIDIHKSVLMVVVATAEAEVADAAGEALAFECRRFGTGASEREHLVAWLQERGVTEVVMESTAQYWKPVWHDLEPHFAKLHLAQAQSNRAPKGRKDDFRDAKRLTRRLLAGELRLSFVPGPEQRIWRTLTRSKCQLTDDRVRLRNQLEALLEEMGIKLSAVVSDLLGASGRRILAALGKGESDPAKLAEYGDGRLHCSREELADALRGQPKPRHIAILKLFLERLKLYDEQIDSLNRLIAEELRPHQTVVSRVGAMPGFGVDSAQQIIAEVGHEAAAFDSADAFASWGAFCPGSNITAEQNHSSRCAKGNRFVRRILTEAAQAAIKRKGCHFQTVFRRFLPKLGYNGALWATAHAIARVLWKILHDGVDYVEKGQETTPQAKKRRAQRLKKALRDLGYIVTLTPAQAVASAPGR
jgi:transposase